MKSTYEEEMQQYYEAMYNLEHTPLNVEAALYDNTAYYSVVQTTGETL